jgi:phage terminase large subunit
MIETALNFGDTKTRVFDETVLGLKKHNARIIVNRGGTRSSKTVSIQQIFAGLSFVENKQFLVSRRTFPALRLTAMKDFQEVLERQQLTDYFHHNKTYHFWTNKQTGSEIHFISTENEAKIRGSKWDYINLNEADQFTFEQFRALIYRSPGQMILDFNPSDSQTWINTEVEQKRKDYHLVQSSYLDNHFLEQVIIDEIEYLRETDPEYYHVFGKGEYGDLKHKIYNNWQVVDDEVFDSLPTTDEFYGFDDGFVHPRVLVHCKYYDGAVYVDQAYFESYKEIDHMIDFMEASGVHPNDPIYCETANREHKDQIYNAGFNALNANKRVKSGINYVKRFKVYVTKRSPDIWKQYNSYFYKQDKDGKLIEEPVKMNDDSMDAIRYAIITHLNWVFTK